MLGPTLIQNFLTYLEYSILPPKIIYDALTLLSANGYIIGVRVGARTGYVIPGRDGNGGWRFGKILPPPSSPPSASSTSKNRFFGENGILRFVTHSRAMNFLASAYESYGRGGSFLF